MRSRISARGWSLIAVALAVALGVIPVALTSAFTIRLPANGTLPPLPGAEALDYLNRPSRLSPLSPRFIEHILGADLVASQGVGERSTLSPRELRELREATGRITDVHQLNNDAMTEARVIPSIPFTAKTDTRGATRAAEDPSECGSVGSTVWYRFTPGHDLGLIAYTFGTDHATILGVFTGGPGDLRLVGCQTNTAGNALVAFSAKAKQTYYFQIAAPLGGGDLVFSLDPHGTRSLASRSSSGEEANGGSSLSFSLSEDGRYVVFASNATNLVPGTDATPCTVREPRGSLGTPCAQIYIRDMLRGTTELISATHSGEHGNAESYNPFVSADGRYVVYDSMASNLRSDDPDDGYDLFVYDHVTRRTEEIPGAPSPNLYGASQGSISDDGRYVVFESEAANVIPADTNADQDVFVYDRELQRTERVSVSSSGEQMGSRARNGGSLYPSISADGRYVEFMSDASTLVRGDTNGVDDTFLHDRLTRTTERVSVSMTGEQGDAQSWAQGFPNRRISAGGRYVVFSSSASNLVPGDTNNGPDVFVRDRVANTTIRVSDSPSPGRQEIGLSTSPWGPSFASISKTGRYVVFDSTVPNLAPGDTAQDWDVFLYDLVTRTTILVSLSPSGEDASGQGAAISGDGRVAAYLSGGADRDGNFYPDNDLFVYEAPRLR